MWLIIKFGKSEINILKHELMKKIGEDIIIFIPKIKTEFFKNNKVYSREVNLFPKIFPLIQISKILLTLSIADSGLNPSSSSTKLFLRLLLRPLYCSEPKTSIRTLFCTERL